MSKTELLQAISRLLDGLDETKLKAVYQFVLRLTK